MKDNQTKNLFKNSFITGIIFILQMIMSFITRTLFIKYLGVEILGFNGVMSNLLMVLSVAELGIGPALIYSLYKPLAEEEENTVKLLMKFYKKVYTVIGMIIAFLGLIMLPFLPLIIDRNSQVDHIYLYYLLFLANTVVSYFFTYKRSIVIADQKNYVVAFNDFIYWMMFQVSSCIAIVFYDSFLAYLILQLLSTIVANLSISFIADKRYPYLKKESPKTRLPNSLKEEIKKNTIGQFTNKVGNMVVTGTDNIVISIFIGLTQVGLYVNYTLIVTSVTNLINQIIGSMTATIGNIGVTSSREEGEKIFENHLFFVYSIAYFCSVYLLVLLNPFIELWLGNKFIFSFTTVVIIVINFAITITRKSAMSFIDAYGLAWHQRYKPIVEAVLNLFFSVTFVTFFKMGVEGVLLGTIISSLLVSCWYEPYVLFKYGFKQSFGSFAIPALKNMAFLSAGFILAVGISFFFEYSHSFLSLLILFSLTTLFSIILYLLLNFRRLEFQWFLKKFLKK